VNDIAESLRYFVKESFLFGRDDAFSDADSFLDMGIIDSTGVLELVAFVESTYGIAVKDEELVPENLDSIENLVRFVEAKRSTCLPSAVRYEPSALDHHPSEAGS
jgi:acyl carrier protein